MIVAFTLSMPTANSWNGKWSGEGRVYAIIKTFRTHKAITKVADLLRQRSFSYRWSDGWCACVSVKEVDSAEAKQLRKKSVGFAGYDWMVDSILQYGKIYASHEVPEGAAT